MIAKTFEVLDRMTFIPVLAVKLEPSNEADRYLLSRAGYGTTPEKQARYVLLARLVAGTGLATIDPFVWGDGTRTLMVAHSYIREHFDRLESGAVVDVEHILGQSPAPKASERKPGKHPSHVTRISDASSFDEVCVNCGARDKLGGWGTLAEPCSAAPRADHD